MIEEHSSRILSYIKTIKAFNFNQRTDIEALKNLLMEIKDFAYSNNIPSISEEQNRITFKMLDGIKKNDSKESLEKRVRDIKKELLTDLMHALPAKTR
ncbi:hypothetical protein [Pedobacter frigidisoli]|uniref:hypothetical protein n=1 Tax=Pedobacter frigidisoli TaxID=2530455 RepID=UPI00292D59B8|nr:hypothetical protein [Pedobacter frigidisoli]